MERTYEWVLIAAVVVLLILSGLAVTPAVRPRPTAVGGTAGRSSPSSSSVADLLQSASTSLATGAGPARGVPLGCGTVGGQALSCARRTLLRQGSPAPSASARPGQGQAVRSSDTPSPAWFDQTGYINGKATGGANYSQFGAAASYDPITGQVVLFGGCSAACPSDQTWTWDGSLWTNRTPNLGSHPPAVYGESMAWDPAYNATIEVGGVLANGSVSNMTWELTSTTSGYAWTNLTRSVGTYGAAGTNGTAFASLAYDNALKELILVDGCAVGNCTEAWSYTWALNGTGWSDLGRGPVGAGRGSYLYGGSMAYDRVDQEMVFFGGYSVALGTAVNFTYVLPSNRSWTNITRSSASCSSGPSCLPEGRYGASMTWDGQLDEILLVGGYSSSAGRNVNDTWSFSAGTWSTEGSTGVIPGTNAVLFAAMPANSSAIAPVLLGGEATHGGTNGSWVFEIPPQPEFVRVAPNPTDVDVNVSITGTNRMGSGSGPLILGEIYDNYSGRTVGYYPATFSTTFTYSANFTYPAGAWAITLYEVDYFGVNASATYDITSNPSVAVAVTASSSPTELSGGVAPVRFTSTIDGGTGPYAYAWSFGDHSGSSTPNITHEFTTSGTFDGSLNVTDSLGVHDNATFRVVVYPQLQGSCTANVTATETGARVSFTGSAGGGSGTYTGESWQFGEGGPTASGSSASHAFGATGAYTVYFNITDSLGFVNSTQLSVTVYPGPLGTAVANVSATDVDVPVGFIGTATGGPGSYRAETWQFGERGPTFSGLAAVHAFTVAATYTVYFNVTDSLGFSCSTQLSVVVNPALDGMGSASSTSPRVGEVVTFLGGSVNGTAPVTYRWQFGDGTSASTAMVNHTFDATGSYTVTLTVTDAVGAKVVRDLTVTVSAKPSSFLGSLTSGTGLYALVGVAVVVVVAAGAGALLRRRRRDRRGDQTASSGASAPGTEASAPPPPADTPAAPPR